MIENHRAFTNDREYLFKNQLRRPLLNLFDDKEFFNTLHQLPQIKGKTLLKEATEEINLFPILKGEKKKFKLRRV